MRVDELLALHRSAAASDDLARTAVERQQDVLELIRTTDFEIATMQRDLDLVRASRDRLVLQAHRQGASWAQIGRSLGISPQAAQQRAKRLSQANEDSTKKGAGTK